MPSNRNITSASGYEALSNTALGTGVVYAGMIRDRNWESDFIPQISNTQILDDLNRCGQSIQFDKPPRVGSWRTYEKNQNMVSDQVTSDAFCLSICKAAYKSLKFDKLDIYKACEHWDAFEQAFLDDAWRQLSDLWHRDLITGLILQASSRNAGKTAGKYNNIDMGTIAAPLNLTPENLIGFLSKASELLDMTGRWFPGEMFMLVPRAFNTLVLQTVYDKAWCCNPEDGVLVKGMKTPDLHGFSVYETDKLRPTVDRSTGKLVYPIVFGWRDAYGFSGDILEAELRPSPGNSFGVVYNMMSVFGGGVIYPEALGKAYVTFSTDGLVTV